MAHANLHMAAGMAAATAVTLWPVLSAWRRRAPIARPVGRMLLASYALGAWALVPNLLTSLGLPGSVHRAWWANVFLGHAAIDLRNDGGLLVGELVIVAIVALHFAVLVLGIWRARPPGGAPPASGQPRG